jgi:hypothetical protein
MVEYLFTAEEWQKLPAAERARRCSLLAEESRRLAGGRASLELKETYLELAMMWLQLAGKIERERGVHV